jgi:hypothetical protein
MQHDEQKPKIANRCHYKQLLRDYHGLTGMVIALI